MRILVTGGAGYVGSVSVELLVERGHEVLVLDNHATGVGTADLAGAELVDGTYGDRDAVRALLADRGIEAVLHCAARSVVPESVRNPALYYVENVQGGIALLEAMRLAGVNRLVISSTAAVYGEPDEVPIPEDAPLRPINTYGETKRTLETAAGWYASAYGLRPVALRYFNVAGASARNAERHDPEPHLIPNLLKAVRNGQPFTLTGTDYPTPDGTTIRDYLHVLDLADAHLAALEATAPGDPRTEGLLALNLGSGRGFGVREVIAEVERVLGQRLEVREGPRRGGDPPALVAKIDRAHDVLGWTPARSTLEEMIGSAWAMVPGGAAGGAA
ncbi:MAG TPA: UDP-glucose 4-epimerase GalE [Candidatus Dormibacteraeota bacterium]|nr:UDP-glucose 4-epimerase GalE [Candidatus Dormibacteraeota bacterium]